MDWPAHTQACILCLLSLLSVTLTRNCTFPSYLDRGGSPWRHHLQFDGESYVFKNYIFNGSSLTVQNMKGLISGNHQLLESYPYKCESVSSDHKYIISTPGTKSDKEYSCIQFFPRDDNIVQYKKSQMTFPQKLDYLCEDESMEFESWVMMQFTDTADEEKTCPVDGGFIITSAYAKSGIKLDCFDNVALEKFENECSAGEGMLFRLTKKCADQFGINFLHSKFLDSDRYSCMGSWNVDKNAYLLIIEKAQREQKLFCLKYPTDYKSRSTFDMYIYEGPFCHVSGDMPRSHKFVRLTLSKNVLTSVCSDENPNCASVLTKDQCEAETHSDWCGSFCYGCDKGGSWNSVTFDSLYQGEWSQIETENKGIISFRGKSLSLPDHTTMNIYQEPYRTIVDGNTVVYTAVSLADNGCSPRMYHVKIRNISRSIIAMSMSRSKPTTTYQVRHPPSYVQGSDVETYTPESDYAEHKILVRHPVNNQILVDCNFTKTYASFQYSLKMGNVTCSEVKISLRDEQGIDTSLGNCNDASKEGDIKHFCIYSTWNKYSNVKYIVTRSEPSKGRVSYYLWYLPLGSDKETAMYWIDARSYLSSIKQSELGDLQDSVMARLNGSMIVISGEPGLVNFRWSHATCLLVALSHLLANVW